jgi:activating signal cointegrator complex subunit 2
LGSLSELDEDKSHMDSEPSVLEKLDNGAGEKTVNMDRDGGKSVQMVPTDDAKTEKLADAKTGGCEGETQGARTDLYVASVCSDVISVSKELWVGSLGNSAAEPLVRSKFEEFGPLTNFLFYPSKDFALVEYGNIVHAVQACAHMRGSSIWGGGLQIRYLDRLIGSKGFIGGIAVGESCHIYVAKVKNQKEKDEVLDELNSAGLKRPCGFVDISSENALLLEFETAVDAAVAKAHIRRQAHSDVCSQDKSTAAPQLLVQNMDKAVPDTEFMNAFTRFGEVSRWQFNRLDGNCLIDYKSQNAAACAKSQMHGARFGLKSISVESRTSSAGSVHDKTLSSVIRMPGQNVSDSTSHQEIRLGYPFSNPYMDRILAWICCYLAFAYTFLVDKPPYFIQDHHRNITGKITVHTWPVIDKLNQSIQVHGG